MARCAGPAEPRGREDGDGKEFEVRECVGVESDGGADQYAGEFRGAFGRDGGGAAVGGYEEEDGAGGRGFGVGGAFQNLPVHLRFVDYMVSRVITIPCFEAFVTIHKSIILSFTMQSFPQPFACDPRCLLRLYLHRSQPPHV